MQVSPPMADSFGIRAVCGELHGVHKGLFSSGLDRFEKAISKLAFYCGLDEIALSGLVTVYEAAWC